MTLQKIPTGIKFPLYEGVKLINAAIEAADKAQQDSTSSKITSANALATSQSAETKAESVQEQYNQMIIDGDSSPMITQALAGTPYTTLKEKHDAVDEQLADTTQFRHKKRESSGLNLYFGEGKLNLADGKYINFVGGSVTVPNNQTSEIMLDIQDLSLHAFPRAIHRGAVHLATVTASNGVVTSLVQPINFELKKSRIEKSKRALKGSNQTVRIAILGDSLFEGAGSGTFWTKLLFDSSTSAEGFNITNLSNARVNYFAVGSQTSHFGMVQLGKAVRSNGASGSNGAKLVNTAITYGNYYDARYFSSPTSLKESVLRTGQYDLAIIGFGANGGTYKSGYLENIVKMLRDRGTEVIIVTENNRTDNSNFMAAEGLEMARIAEVWGCELADSWSYVKEAQNKGLTTHADVIHMAQEGHYAWAKAVRSILNDRDQQLDMFDKSKAVRVITYDDTNLAKKFQSLAEVQFTPFETNGTVKGGNVTDSFKNVAIHYGGKTPSNYITELSTGQNAWFAHAHAHAVDFLFDYFTEFTAEIRDSGGNVLGSISEGSAGLDRVGLVEGVKAGVYGSISGANPGYKNQGINVVCTSGKMRLIGAVFYTWENKELPLKDIEYIGSWNEETWIYQHPFSKYSDTIGDSLVFEFEGTGCQLLLGSRSASGTVDVYLDGQKVYSGIDLYSTGNYLYSVDIFTLRSNGYFNRGYGKHVVKVVLTGTNASAITPSTSNRRLQLLGGYTFDGR